MNLFKEAGVPPKRKLTRFLITPDAAVQPGEGSHRDGMLTHTIIGDFAQDKKFLFDLSY